MKMMATIFALVFVMTVPMAFASSTIGLQQIDNVVSLSDSDAERYVSVWAEFSDMLVSNLDILVQVFDPSNNLIDERNISVVTNSESSTIDFNSFLRFNVNPYPQCISVDADLDSLCNMNTGDYSLVVTSNGVTESTSFSIVD